ncbi:MAG TPA: NAD-dependent epimerase/dehydratase family protein [Candidatus Limnocylindrales bacterium]|nr:NAD-dependent epimerase/dehydratase family protein [Candidatus Limnocylindrales bacterium]
MSEILLTGATGLLGNAIARALVAQGRSVRALVRSPERARAVVPAACELVQGDVTDIASVRSAAAGCRVFYHAAGLPEQWLPDAGTFDGVNVGGTVNCVAAALEVGVERFVYTSTIDVFVFGAPGEPFDESSIDPQPKATAYERSKQAADRVVTDAVARGLPAVFLHPSGIYGAGPETSPGTNQLIADLVRGKVPMLLPGGMPLVYSDDAAGGHLLAEQKAEVGARYILSESYRSLLQVAEDVRAATGTARVPPVMPLFVAHAVALAGELVSALTGRPPLLPKGQLHFLQYEAHPVATRAERELGWAPRPFERGLLDTLAFLREARRI